MNEINSSGKIHSKRITDNVRGENLYLGGQKTLSVQKTYKSVEKVSPVDFPNDSPKSLSSSVVQRSMFIQVISGLKIDLFTENFRCIRLNIYLDVDSLQTAVHTVLIVSAGRIEKIELE